MKKLFLFFNLKDKIYPIVIIFIAVVISIANFTPDTYLSGWDTLHPEFNYKLNLFRTITGVFRPEQGLGALSAHAHMVEIPRIIQLWLYDIFLPQNAVRYTYIFSNLILGPLGMYYFLNKIVIKRNLPSFLGALFYLLNLGTYQTFLVPFEMFTTLYAAIPWVFLTLHNFLDKLNKKNALFFVLALLFTIPSAYASSLWFVFLMALGIYFTTFILASKDKLNLFKKFVIALILIFAVNSYWLLPNLYFALNGAKEVSNSNINLLFSESAFLKNKEFGTFDNILSLKTFYFDWGIYDYKAKAFTQLTEVFQIHLNNMFVEIIGGIFAGLFMSGMILSFKFYRKFFAPLIAVTLFSLLFLFNDNPPLSPFFNFIQDNVPLFKEALRFPNNKILNIFIFIFTIYFAIALSQILTLLNRFGYKNITRKIFSVGIALVLIIYMLPVFTGNLIHPNMRIQIPDEYFNLFNYLEDEETGRVANFPVHSPWGWTYHNWYDNKPSFQGAGFLYFGMPQSILERDFDRWNTNNEQYYKEMSYAIYSKSERQIKEIIEKYNISYLLLDKSVIAPGADSQSLYLDETEQLFENLVIEDYLDEAKEFGNYIFIYRVKNYNKYPLKSLNKVVNANAYSRAYYSDNIYSEHKNYFTYTDKKNQINYPLISLFSNESKVDESFFERNDTKIDFNLDSNYLITNYEYEATAIPSSAIVNIGLNSTSVSLYPITPQFNNESIIQPITGSFEVDGSKPLFLSINNAVFPLARLSKNTPIVLGSIFLSKEKNNFAVFDKEEQSLSYRFSDIALNFSRCATQDNSNLNIFIRPNSINFEGNLAEDLCIYIPLSFIQSNTYISENILVEINFVTKNNSSAFSTCIADIASGNCLENLSKQTLNNSITLLASVNKDELYEKQFIIKTTNADGKNVEIQNVNINTYQSISESRIGSSFLDTSLPEGNFSSISIPAFINNGHIYNPDKEQGIDNKCNPKENKSSKRLIENAGGNYFEYKSSDGSFCDSISFDNLPHYLSYFVFVRSKNIENLPMTICITNQTTRRCDIYSKLSTGNQVNEDIFYLPAGGLGNGYDINLENSGLLRSPSKNALYSISFVPVPLDMLSKINSNEAEFKNYDGKVSDITFYNASHINFKVQGSSSLIELNAPYLNGFNLYKIECTEKLSCFVKSLLSPFFGIKTGEKVKINSWANGWIIENNDQNFTYSIIYVPQYLQFLGYIMFAITILITTFGNNFHLLKDYGKNTNSFFEKKAEFFKLKIAETNKIAVKTFPYSINLAGKR